MLFKFFLIVALISYVESAKLPPFLKACAIDDSKCAVEVANKGIPILLDGYKPFKMRSFNPFKFDRLDLSTGSSLKFLFTNGKISNLKSIQVTDFSVDVDKRNLSMKVTLDPVVDADYEVDGRILVLPIQGTGKAHIEFNNVELEGSASIKVVTKKGEDYYKPENDEVKLKVGSMKIKLDNLFNGDKKLGDELNLFLNENWEEVEKEFHNGMIELIRAIVLEAVHPIFNNVPVSELIL